MTSSMVTKLIKHIESFDQIKVSVKYYDGDDKRWAIRLSMCIDQQHESVMFLREPYKEGSPYYLIVGCGKGGDKCYDDDVAQWIEEFILSDFDAEIDIDVLDKSYLQGRPKEPNTRHLLQEANELLSILEDGNQQSI